MEKVSSDFSMVAAPASEAKQDSDDLIAYDIENRSHFRDVLSQFLTELLKEEEIDQGKFTLKGADINNKRVKQFLAEYPPSKQ